MNIRQQTALRSALANAADREPDQVKGIDVVIVAVSVAILLGIIVATTWRLWA